MTKRYGLISVITGGLAIFAFTFIAGIASMVTAYLGMKASPEEGESEVDRKNIYFCMLGLVLTIFAFWLHSYVF